MPVVYLPESDRIAYDPLKEDVLYQKSSKLLSHFAEYAKQHNLALSDVCIQRSLIPLIILRVDQREGYFVVYHKQTRINEIKQAALVAYWILKFRPFMIITDDPDRSHEFRRINEGFAAFYLLSAINEYSRRQGKTVMKEHVDQQSDADAHLSESLVKELLHAFTYWDLSKEAVILNAETIGEAFFGIEAQGLEDEK